MVHLKDQSKPPRLEKKIDCFKTCLCGNKGLIRSCTGLCVAFLTCGTGISTKFGVLIFSPSQRKNYGSCGKSTVCPKKFNGYIVLKRFFFHMVKLIFTTRQESLMSRFCVVKHLCCRASRLEPPPATLSIIGGKIPKLPLVMIFIIIIIIVIILFIILLIILFIIFIIIINSIIIIIIFNLLLFFYLLVLRVSSFSFPFLRT